MKKLISAVLALSLIASASVISANAQDFLRPKYGDVNHDKRIDLQDVVTIQKHLAELDDFTICLTCANVDGDELTLKDVSCLQKHIAGIKSNSQCGKESEKPAVLAKRKLDNETKDKLEKSFLETNPIGEKEKEYILKNYGKLVYSELYDVLSDGTLIVEVRYYGSTSPQITPNYKVGEYLCHSSQTYLYINGQYLWVNEALKQGLISDKLLEEIAFKLHMIKE